MLTMFHLLNNTVVRSSNLILDIHVDTTTSDFGVYDAPNLQAIPQLMV